MSSSEYDTGALESLASDLTTDFALRLYRSIASNPGDFVFSPISVYTGLLASFFGARGETRREISSLLRLEDGDIDRAVSACASVASISSSDAVEFSVATSLWTDEQVRLLEPFVRAVEEIHAEVKTVDFRHPERARQIMNDWVRTRTREKITELIPLGGIDTLTKILLANAIYFAGRWREPFAAEFSTEEPFWIDEHNSVSAIMMRRQGQYNYADTGRFQILELPYVGNEVSMFILLPASRTGLSSLENDLDTEYLARLTLSLVPTIVDVIMPRFRKKSHHCLTETLQTLGLRAAVTPAGADFSGIDDGSNQLWISNIFQETTIKVDEAGTVATAAIAMVMKMICLTPEFRVDRPFLFYILHEKTRNILFMGRISNPA